MCTLYVHMVFFLSIFILKYFKKLILHTSKKKQHKPNCLGQTKTENFKYVMGQGCQNQRGRVGECPCCPWPREVGEPELTSISRWLISNRFRLGTG